MNIYLLFIVIISLFGIKIYFKDYNKDYIDKNNSSYIKGIFILVVFASHIIQYAKYNKPLDKVGLNFLLEFGQLMVTMFLFYSGYGVYESIKNKGKQYVNSMPKKRILNTLINFDLSVLLYFGIYLLFEKDFQISRFLLSLIAWDGYGNSNWYIFCILGLYLITYCSLRIFGSKKGIISIWICTIAFYIFLSMTKEHYWYNTLFCYPLGITYSYFKDKIDKVLSNNKNYLIVLLILLIINPILFVYRVKNMIIFDVLACTFSLLVVIISFKIKFRSKILLWFGNNLFWVYMLQRLPMILLTYFKYNTHQYRFFVLCFILTILMTIIVNYIKKSKKILN